MRAYGPPALRLGTGGMPPEFEATKKKRYTGFLRWRMS